MKTRGWFKVTQLISVSILDLNPGSMVPWASQVVLVVKNLPANEGNIRDVGSIPESGKIPWRRRWQPAPVFLPGESHGERNLAGYSPQGRKESDTTEATERTYRAHSLVPEALWYGPSEKTCAEGTQRRTYTVL